MQAFFITIPHAGERVPPQTPWLHNLSEPVLMCDVDRFVDRLYLPVLKELKLPHVVTEWHRYVVDLNRLPDDIGPESVEGSSNPHGKFWNGLHWVRTTRGHTLMPKPMSQALHDELVKEYFNSFHEKVRAIFQEFFRNGFEKVYHLDAHSMPSVGTKEHNDPGERRADIVVSDQKGTSCDAKFKDLVIEAYQKQGLKVGYNWPYYGGRVTQTYGKPSLGQHTLQVELNRALYMDEETKQWVPELAEPLQIRLAAAVRYVAKGLEAF